jgi:hypothetical protein
MGQCADSNRDSFYSWFTLAYIAMVAGLTTPPMIEGSMLSWSHPCPVRRRSTFFYMYPARCILPRVIFFHLSAMDVLSR